MPADTWPIEQLVDLVANRLQKEAAADDAAQAVYGIDNLEELALHPLVQEAFAEADLGVVPEQRYPSQWHHRRQSKGERCDLVLTRQQLPLRDAMMRRTLFAHQPAEEPEDAFWLEIKNVAQFHGGSAASNYAHQLMNPVAADIRKLAADPTIQNGGLLLILFTAGRETAEHDLAQWYDQCRAKQLPLGQWARRGFPLNDRTGNAWTDIILFPIERQHGSGGR